MQLLENTQNKARLIGRKILPFSIRHRIHDHYRRLHTRLRYKNRYWRKKVQEALSLAEQIENISYQEAIKEKWAQQFQIFGGEVSHKNAIIEINNTCNIDCLMCKTSLSTRNKGVIQEELLELAIQRLKKAGYYKYSLHTIGDPLATSKLKQVLELLRKYNVKTSLATNGLLLYRHIDTLLEYRDVCSLG